jgi:hypothetical protein
MYGMGIGQGDTQMTRKRKPWVLEMTTQQLPDQWFECDRFYSEEEAMARRSVVGRGTPATWRVRRDETVRPSLREGGAT